MTINVVEAEVLTSNIKIGDKWTFSSEVFTRLEMAAQGMDLHMRDNQFRLCETADDGSGDGFAAVMVFLRVSGMEMRNIALGIRQSNYCLALKLGRHDVVADVCRQIEAAKVAH